MRVESKPTGVLGMGKRKLKLRKQQKNANEFPDSSDDNAAVEVIPSCTHHAKAVNLTLVRKAVKNLGLTGECTTCKSSDKSKKGEGHEAADSSDDGLEITVWLCLQCGNQGCDRNSKHKHALKHYDTPRSSAHHLVLNLTTFVIWCYGCDDEVLSDVSKKLSECVEFVKKQLGVAPTQPHTSGKRGSQHRPHEVGEEIVEKEENRTQGNTGKHSPTLPQQLLPPKVKGLSNLGNTCFFNAVMQNLSQTPVLANILSEHGKKGVSLQLPGQLLTGERGLEEDVGRAATGEEEMKLELSPLTIRLEDGGALTYSVMSFMTDMTNYTVKSQVITPSGLFGQVCKKAPRFKGFQQQDSHELLRYLLDGMKAEEIKRCQAGILKAFSVSQNTKQVDEETKVKVKEYGAQVKHTFVDSLFGGAFISTVHCEECQVPSQILEPFLDISLPVTEEKTIRPGNLGRKPVKSTATDTVDKPIDYKPSGPSKHMRKKERKEAKKKKGKKQGSKTGMDEKVEERENNKDTEQGEGATDTLKGEDDASGPAAANGVAGDKLGASTEMLEGMSAANSEQNLADSEEEDSDADIEDNDDGCRSSPVDENGSQDSVKDLSSAETAVGLRGGSTDALLSDCGHKHSQDDDTCCPDVPKISSDIEMRTTESGISQVSNYCDKCTSQESIPLTTKDEVLEDDDSIQITSQEETKESSNTKKSLIEGKVVNGIVKEITESLKNIHVSTEDKMDQEEMHSNLNSNRKSLSFEDEQEDEEVQNNIANINKNALSNSNPNLHQHSPKLSRSSSSRSSINNTKSRNQLKMEARTEAMKSLAPSRYQPDSRECSIQSCLNQFTAAELLTGANKFGCENCSHRAKQNKDEKQQMVYTNASKQLLIFSPPAILTLHMKRFQQVGFSLRKVNRHVDFPLVLDIAPYCSVLSQGVDPCQQKVLYSLYGIVEHSGRLSGGHYTAYVKVRPNSTTQVKAFLQQNNLQTAQLDQLLLSNMEALDRLQGAVGGTEEGEEIASSPGKWYYISDSRVSETTESQVLRCQAYLLFYERIC